MSSEFGGAAPWDDGKHYCDCGTEVEHDESAVAQHQVLFHLEVGFAALGALETGIALQNGQGWLDAVVYNVH